MRLFLFTLYYLPYVVFCVKNEAEVEVDPPWLGWLDYVLIISGTIFLITYWFFRRRWRAVPVPSNSFTFQPVINNDNDVNKNVTSGLLGKLRHSGRRFVVIFGSQTGTAEEFAIRLAKEGARFGMRGIVADPEEFDLEDISQLAVLPKEELGGEVLVAFTLATYGEGDPTDNAQELFEWLQNGNGDLSGLNYAVFGLGNTTYENYNAMGIYVDRRIEELGGNRIYPLGNGNDDDNLEDDFITWMELFWNSVCNRFDLQAAQDQNVSIRQYQIIMNEDIDEDFLYKGEPARLRSFISQRPPFDQKNPFLAPLVVNKNLMGSFKENRICLHLEFSIENSRIRYDAGDHVAIFPQNDSDLVLRLAELLEIDLDTKFSLVSLDEDSSKKNPFPCPTTYRTALTYYIEITALPHTHVLKELSKYTSNEEEVKMLQLLSGTSTEGKEMYSSWVIDASRNIIHILEDLPGVKVPVDHLMELLPRLQPRYYSISSSSLVHPTKIHVTAVVIKYETSTGRINRGVTTNWLNNLVPVVSTERSKQTLVPLFIRRSQFRLPSRDHVPVIMIGPGTGLAPFRGFIQERAYTAASTQESIGSTHLYFGCRHEASDYIYRSELEEWADSNPNFQLFVCFSRDSPSGHKRYVTHLLEENSADVWNIIGLQSGHLYVCGEAKNMAKDVRKVIVNIVAKYIEPQSDSDVSKSKILADEFVKKMEQQKRYCSDVWS